MLASVNQLNHNLLGEWVQGKGTFERVVLTLSGHQNKWQTKRTGLKAVLGQVSPGGWMLTVATLGLCSLGWSGCGRVVAGQREEIPEHFAPQLCDINRQHLGIQC
jgi:hypothetical protein